MKPHGYVIQFVPDGSLLDLLEAHAPFLQTTIEELVVGTATVTHDRWKDYFHYHNRFFAEVQYAIGDGNLPENRAEFPGLARPSETSLPMSELA